MTHTNTAATTNTAAIPTIVPTVVTYTYLPPLPPPASGAEWAEEEDWPGVMLRLELPLGDSVSLAPELRDPDAKVLGEPLHQDWGTRDHNGTTRWRQKSFRAKTLEEAEAQAVEAATAATRRVAIVLALREARLARRASIIAHSHARPGRYVRPPE